MMKQLPGKSKPRLLANRIVVDYIETGTLDQGDRLPSIRELEAHYGVSRASMVQALSMLEQEGRILRRHGVGSFLAKHTTVPSVANTALVGCIVTCRTSNVELRLSLGVEEECSKYGMYVMVAAGDQDYETEKRHVDTMAAAGCKAIIIDPVFRTEEQLKSDYLNSTHLDLPIVLVDLPYPMQHRPQIVFDNYQAGVDMTELLIDAGHQEIAFMKFAWPTRLLTYSSNHERCRGYLETMRLRGLSPRCWEIACPERLTMGSIQRILSESLRSSNPPTAVIALNDTWAMHTIRMAQAMRVGVPGDLCVVGFDDISQSTNFTPQFPTTRPDFQKAGQIAARIALQIGRGEHAISGTYILPVPIVPRGLNAPNETNLNVYSTENGDKYESSILS